MAKQLKILATAKQRGSVNALAPVIQELKKRNHQVSIYATGNEAEAVGFNGLEYQRISPSSEDYTKLIQENDIVLTGLSGFNTPDGEFLRNSIKLKIPVITVADQDINYKTRLGQSLEYFPDLLAVMDKGCIATLKQEFGEQEIEKLQDRIKVIGWTAFDNYSNLREKFTEKDREKLLQELKLEARIILHFTQNIHPNSDYMKLIAKGQKEKKSFFDYETKLTRKVFETASDLGLRLTIKPHPGERFEINYTLDLTKKHGFTYLPADSCDTRQLILASDSITAGTSTCLTEACLLDKNTGGLFPDKDEREIKIFPPVALQAIPYTQTWSGIKPTLGIVSSDSGEVKRILAQKRKRFSVDGKASERLVNLIEDFCIS